MKKQHGLILIGLVVLSVIGIRAWPGAPSNVQAAAPVEGVAVLTQLSGRVYEGAANTEPPTSTGIGGVTVRVYGATKPDTMYGDLLRETTTDADGWYGLDFNEERYTYYNIVETDPSTHYSVWSSSVSGVRKDNNWIQYEAPIEGSGKTTTGNKFWDLPRVTPTHTSTPRLTPTHTPTRPPDHTPTPSPTAWWLQISCPAWATLQCTSPTDPSNTGEPIVQGDCGTPQVSYADTIIPGNCSDEYTIERIWTATDDCGNTVNCMQKITVQDWEAPVISCPPDVSIVEGESSDPSNTGMPTGYDDCDANVAFTYSDAVDSPGPNDPIIIERTWTATDNCGHTASCVQIIVVVRSTPTPTGTLLPRTPTPTITRPVQTHTPTLTPRPECDYLTADFDWTAFCAGNFTFSDKSTTSPSDPIDSWQWHFGDGATSSLQNPSHTYGALGMYDVTLTVRTRNGCEASISKQVEAAYPAWVLDKELVSPVGRPVYVGDEVTYRLVVGAVPPDSILDYSLVDCYDYFDFVSASPEPDLVYSPGLIWPECSDIMCLEWLQQGSIASGAQRQYYVTLRVTEPVEPPMVWQACNRTKLSWIRFAPNDCEYSDPISYCGGGTVWACVEAGPQPSALTLTKTLLEPASGVAQVGDVVSFLVEARNLGTMPITDFDVWDSFLDAEYDFVFASPAPTSNTSDGTNRTLTWDSLSLPPGGAFAILLELRTKMPGVLTNCARTVEWVEVDLNITQLQPVFGPESCASVQVEAPEGKHFTIWKRFTVPSNHIANLGDSLSFDTECRITGTEPAVRLDVFDHIAPASASSFLPLNAGFLGLYQTGHWAEVSATFKAKAVASPAVNTAEWTVTWPDGSKETKIAQDHVYIVDGEIGKGLFIDKSLLAPLAGAAISDTVRFRIAITNVTGIDLPSLPLEDTFPAQCLSFMSATRPPDQALPGKVVWNDLGPLPSGHMMAVEAWFHADAVCPAALNCATSVYGVPGAAPQTVADCAPVTIRGDQPRLVLSKRRTSPSPAHVGDLVSWQIVLQNGGTAPLATVPLHDGYQNAFLEYQSAVPAPDGIDLINGRLDWTNVGPLHAGQAVTVTLTALAKAPGVGVLNCGESTYTVGSSTFTPYQCATVDIVARGPAIGVAKELFWPALGKPLAVGEVAAFTVTLRNTGPVTLTNVVVQDNFDLSCLAFVPSAAMPPVSTSPGQLRWTFPALAPAETHSWPVLFRANNPCNPTHNCVVAGGNAPDGTLVEAEDCVPLNIEEPQPGLRVRKAMVAPAHVPYVGEVIEYELLVKNVGSTTLMIVGVTDSYDPACLAYVAAVPGPDTVEPAAGNIHWNNVGPLAPGDTAILHVSLRALAPCQFAPNCVEARWPVAGAPGLTVVDCVEVPIRGEPMATPTPTATRPPGERTPTPTATRPGGLTPTPTATRPPGELTPTPTATGEPGRRLIYLPIVMRAHPPPSLLYGAIPGHGRIP